MTAQKELDLLLKKDVVRLLSSRMETSTRNMIMFSRLMKERDDTLWLRQFMDMWE